MVLRQLDLGAQPSPTPRKRSVGKGCAPRSSCHRTTTSYAAHSDTLREKQLRQKIKLRIISVGAQIRSVLLVHDDIILVNCAMYGNWVIPHQSQALGIIRMLKQSRLVSELCVNSAMASSGTNDLKKGG